MVFHIIPTALEISLVCGILVSMSPGSIGVRLLHLLDMAVWLQVRSYHGRNYGRLLCLHNSHNIMENKVPQGCQRR
jgi:ABC-type transport system involved in Fe-S cluster assembly fused permease/ATPase subunit